MGLLQKAVETYDNFAEFIGQTREGHTPLAPVSHMLTSAQLEITVDQAGAFCEARLVDKSEPKTIIPATEASTSRTSGIFPHPLCDNLGYVAPYHKEKHTCYVNQLADWCASPFTHPKLSPILKYVEAETILDDLVNADLIKVNPNGIPNDENMLVRWRVIGLDDDNRTGCWEDPSLFQAFIRYYSDKLSDARTGFCLVSGKTCPIADLHPKGIIPINGNAKLISANDAIGFTFRGRISEAWQASEVSYEASQKAHNALRWLASEAGVRVVCGGRTFLCWNPKGKSVPSVTGPLEIADISKEPCDYRAALWETLSGHLTKLKEEDDVVIAAFDAATTGRLALTYYNELKGSDFLQRLYEWDIRCCWIYDNFLVRAPSLWQIVNCAFGTQRTANGKAALETDERVMRQQMQRLVACRIDCAAIPVDFVKLLMQRASTPMAHDHTVHEQILFAACAVIRKYRYDKFKEEFEMALEPNKQDLSYQFGRLLAVLEQVERATYKYDEKREPNAIRFQTMYCQRPLQTAAIIQQQLERACFPKLHVGSRFYFKKLIGQIMEQIDRFPGNQHNAPLKETYLMGYYLQRNELCQPKMNYDLEEEENEDIAE